MNPWHFIIIGAGSAGRAALNNLRASEQAEPVFLDDALDGGSVNGVPVIGRVEDWQKYPQARFLITFGTRALSEKLILFERMRAAGMKFFNALHPSACVDDSAELGEGIVLSAHCAVMSNAVVGDCVFLCANCSIDHDCQVGAGCHFSPGVNVAGNVRVGRSVFLGTNACVVPEIRLGDGAIVGAGAAVIRDVHEYQTVVGVPARPIS